MGCFMACFGLSNKRKRRKTLYKVLDGNQTYGNYEALVITEKPIVPYSGFRKRDECKEKSSVKSKKKKKKVTFNLNVQIYEPNPTDYQVLDNEEEENENTTTAEQEGKRITPCSILGDESAPSTTRYPPNYRYYNCSDEFDEDEIAYEESDIDDDEFDDGYDSDYGDSDESLENDEAEAYGQNTTQKLSDSERIVNQIPLAESGNVLKSNLSDRERTVNNNRIHSVLIPVENLTQWKAIKAKVASSKHNRGNKENVPSEEKPSMPLASEASSSHSPCSLGSSVLQAKPLLPEIAVDASLSNWLISPNYNASMTKIHCQ